MGWWEQHVVPRLVDLACGNAELTRFRGPLCAGLEGRVLELGFGSGLNVDHYPPAVTEVAAVEPNDVAWRRSRERVERSGVRVVRSELVGDRLGEPDASVDHVVSSFTLCTIPHLGTALAEARRVLRPGGTFRFLEHGAAPEPSVRRWQQRLEPVQRRLAGGCHLTRQPADALAEAGFAVVELHTGYLPGPVFTRPMAHLYRGRARRDS